MLQQTQVATVLHYYERFLERFPTVADLGVASLDDVLPLWAGLGYYSRARNLHAAARKVVSEYDGKLPSDVESLQQLPGVGRYTAGAIASIAYGTRAPLLDGNVARVLMRLLAVPGDPKDARLRTQLWTVAETLLPARRCGDFNQALMEIGAIVCTTRSPVCDQCPLLADCQAYRLGQVDQIPAVASKAKVREQSVVIVAVQCGSSLLFVQRPSEGLWAGLWELPSEPVAPGETSQQAIQRLYARLPKCRENGDLPVHLIRQLTHRSITFDIRMATCARRGKVVGVHRWIEPLQLHEVGISSACRAVLRKIGWLTGRS